MIDKKSQEIFFREPRLRMTILGRPIVRLVSYATYGILSAAAAVFLVSEISWLRSAGILLALFLIDRLIDVRKAPRSLDQLSRLKGKINVAWFIRPATYKILERSVDQAALQGGDVTLIIIRNLFERRDIKNSFWRMDVDPDEFSRKVNDYIEKSLEEKQSKKETLDLISAAMVVALAHAQEAYNHYIEPRDLLAGLSRVGGRAFKQLLNLFEIKDADLEYALIFSQARSSFRRRHLSNISGFIGRKHRRGYRIMNRAWTARPTRFLDRFSVDLTDLVRRGGGGFLIGHAQEYDRLTDVLSRADNPNALLVGAAGSGKETIIHHLAFNIIRDNVPAPLFDKRLVSLNIGSIIAGAGEGQIEGRLKNIVSDIVAGGNIVLYIPDIHNLLRTSGKARFSAADAFLPIIKENAFPIIGATYPEEFKNYIEPKSDFNAAFEAIQVKEVNEMEAVRFLVYESLVLEQKYNIVISLGAVKHSVTLAHKYFRNKLLPASASDILNEALADAVEKKKKALTADDIIAVAEKKVNVPIHKIGEKEAFQLLHLEEYIHQRLVDQEPAVSAVARVLREYRSGLSKSGRPIAVFLFVGPTGVGKTELAKILARVHFGSEKFMIRFDMSEYQTKESIFQLIGAPKGESRGSLTDAVRAQPYSLILLDEFEKSHPDVLNIFLSVFDDGRLVDNTGRTIDFQNTIIIATSNAHSEFIKSAIEAGTSINDLQEQIKKKLTTYFKPELLNRFSDIIVFKSLSPEDIKAITRLLLTDLASQVEESNGIILTFDDRAIDAVAKLGYDPVFGARPLRKVISEKVRGALANKILKKEVIRGDTVTVSFDSQEFIFK